MAIEAIRLPAPALDETTLYCLFGLAKAKDGKGDALAARLLALVEPTRGKPGVLQYHVHRDRDDPDLFAFYEA
jgi:quinol monooxygenase YgiN